MRSAGQVLISSAFFLMSLQTGAAARWVPNEELPTLWRSVDAVVHLQIQKSLGVRSRTAETHAALQEYQAKVFEVFRRFLAGPKSTVTLLKTAAASDRGYRPGEEFVAFLRWNESEQAFQTVIMVPVRDGQVKSPYIQGLESGSKLEAFLTKLRAMME